MQFEGTQISHWFLEVETQPEVGEAGYDAGAAMLQRFFKDELKPYLDQAELDPLGRDIIQCCLDNGRLEDYVGFLPMR